MASQPPPPGHQADAWTPGPVSRLESGTPVNPQFHTIWGYVRGNRVYMIRFSNVVSGRIVVDVIGYVDI